MIKRALISVSDKTGLAELAAGLQALDVEILSAGGTQKALADAGIAATTISDATGFPECLDGRVETFHPKLLGGILAVRGSEGHLEQLKKLGIEPIDLVVVNFCPFGQTVLNRNAELEEAIEAVDVGGPAMLRAAAKNYKGVVVVVDPSDYGKVLSEMKATGEVSVRTRFKLAYKVFEHTSHYDALIAKYFRDRLGEEFFPETLSLTFEKAREMRYGENPHQKAVFYREVGPNIGCMTDCRQLHGKELSYNNINDANGAIELLKEFDDPTVVIVKDANPCGVASAETISAAYVAAYEADPLSPFGGVVAANREVDAAMAEEINKVFYEIVLAPSFSEDALQSLKTRKNIRLLQLGNISAKLPAGTYDMKKVTGGLLVQNYNNELVNTEEMKCVTEAKPTEEQLEDLLFALKVVKHTKSSGIVLAKAGQTIGIGPGQTNRITSLRVAVEYGKDKTKGAVMASDAFLPFADCVEEAHKAGITAIIQPGGSVRDQESIDACNRYGIAMIFTGMRHFKH
jgi:phosphoribosylaminoimidazolecarboxamide formyltransferase/IMP cyclohydrolase